jgi:hypothetical protein
MTTLRLALAVDPEESVTVTVKLKVPAAVGVPARIPPLTRVRPPGSVPADTVQAYPAPLPPVAASVTEYDTLTVPPARDVAVIINGDRLEVVVDPPPPQLCSRERATVQRSANQQFRNRVAPKRLR